MDIKHIKDTKCPICNSEVDDESIRSKHTNGEWNEYRKFRCGYRLHFSPNFTKVDVIGTCSKDPKVMEMYKKRNKAMLNLLKYISKLDIDDKFKETLTNRNNTGTY